MSIDISAMMASKSVIDRARALHYLKMQANYLKTVDFENMDEVKDGLRILEKIHQYYRLSIVSQPLLMTNIYFK